MRMEDENGPLWIIWGWILTHSLERRKSCERTRGRRINERPATEWELPVSVVENGYTSEYNFIFKIITEDGHDYAVIRSISWSGLFWMLLRLCIQRHHLHPHQLNSRGLIEESY